MTTDELMQLSAEKAVRECSWASIEFLFRPATMFELLVRIDLDGMTRKVNEWFMDMSPDAIPHRFRAPYLAEMEAAINRETFYRLCREA